MNLDFLSGLLLTVAALVILVYLVTAIVDSGDRDLKKLQENVSDAWKRTVASDTKPVNDHLIGATGKVIMRSDDTARPMRVRINLELWPARLSSTEGDSLAVDTSVKVTAVDGPILIVEADSDATA